METHTYIVYDINDGLVDIILEVTPAMEQRAERAKAQEDRKTDHTMTKEKEHEIREKHRPRSEGSARETCLHITRPHTGTTARTARAKSRQQARCNCHANPRWNRF
jgi:hypothetical protein